MSKFKKTDSEWKSILTPEQYHVVREKGTERPFSGEHDKNFKEGTFKCVACGQPLFRSEDKFDAGCGWPSFSQPIHEHVLQEHEDGSLPGQPRTEVTCERCGAHLGHVFPDGPQELTGQRYCINSVSLSFEDKK